MKTLRQGPGRLALGLASLLGCGYPQPAAEPSTYLHAHRQMDPPPASGAWPIAPAEAERLLWHAALEVRDGERSEGGQQEAFKTRILADGRPVTVKWKRAPEDDLQRWNASPRKDLAAYAVQRWFLDPDDYVVPTVALRCLSREDARRLEPDVAPTLEDTLCVLGTLSLWLEDLEPAEPLYEPERFAREPRYAYHMANLNLYTFLVDHRDSRPDNFLQTRDLANRRVFSVDNEMSFGQRRYNLLRRQWHRLYVPAVRGRAVERLRALRREQVEALETLAVVVQDDAGMLHVSPSDDGSGREPRLRLGLSAEERHDLWERRNELLERVDRGELDLF